VLGVRLSKSRVQALQKILKDDYGIDMTDEAAQQTGLKIVRLLIAKANRHPKLKAKLVAHNRVNKGSNDI
jgi:hypothetical protein